MVSFVLKCREIDILIQEQTFNNKKTRLLHSKESAVWIICVIAYVNVLTYNPLYRL